MNIFIDDSLEQTIQERIKAGLHNSEDKALVTALNFLKEKKDHINEKITIGLKQIENGEYEEMNDQFWTTLEAKIASKIKRKRCK